MHFAMLVLLPLSCVCLSSLVSVVSMMYFVLLTYSGGDYFTLHLTADGFFSSPVGSLCHTPGVVRRPSSVVRRLCRL